MQDRYRSTVSYIHPGRYGIVPAAGGLVVADGLTADEATARAVDMNRAPDVFDTASSASRQNFIDTGAYLPIGWECDCPTCHPLDHSAPGRYEALEASMREAGAEYGRAAASWFFDGNTPRETYQRVLAGLEDGDPEILDSLPSAPLSGEFADSPTPRDVLPVNCPPDWEDDLLRAYEDGFHTASADAIEAACRYQLEETDSFTGRTVSQLTGDELYAAWRGDRITDRAYRAELERRNA